MLYAKSWCMDPVTLRVGPSKPHNWPRLKASICPRCGYNPIFRKPQTSFTERLENKRVSVYQSWLGCCERLLLQVILTSTCCFMFWDWSRAVCWAGLHSFHLAASQNRVVVRCGGGTPSIAFGTLTKIIQNSWQEYTVYRISEFITTLLSLVCWNFDFDTGHLALHAWTWYRVETNKQLVLAGVFFDP